MITRTPDPHPGDGYPSRVTIYEVGARDGLQNEARSVPATVKAEFIRRLAASGLPIIETTSFVNPAWVPQLADAAEVLTLLGEDGVGRNRPVLVPNLRGLDRALASGVRAVAIFGSATETFAHKNLGRSIADSMAMFAPVVERARGEGLWVRAYLSMCFGDPWEGAVPVAQVVTAARALMDLGADELSLGDTIGVATVGHVEQLLTALNANGIGDDRIAVHFHDTYGQALANTLAAVRHGVTTLGRVGSAVAPTQRARRATSPPKTSSGPSTVSASTPVSTWRPSPTRAPGSQATSAGPHPRPSSAPSPRRSPDAPKPHG